jgi:hypothetical protein
MSNLARKYADEVLLLPREFRAELVCKLLESLNVPFQKNINETWIKETEQNDLSKSITKAVKFVSKRSKI